jgi:hypothetical protein
MGQSKLKEIAGQLVYDCPWHCSLCRRRYRRRMLILDWFRTRDIHSGKLEFRRAVVRLCVGDEKVSGCIEMGLRRLFNAHHKNA